MVENNWRQAWLALRFFLIWGLSFGGVLAFISGALIFPLFGATFTVPWGLGIGAGLGVAVGLISGIATLFAQITPENVRKYRRRLSLAIGGLVALAAPTLVHLTSPNILWYPTNFQTWNIQAFSTNIVLNAFWLPSIVATLFWGGLSAAYVAHRFAEYCALNVQDDMEDARYTRVTDHPNDIHVYWMGKFVSRWWLYPVMMVVGGIIHYQMQITQYELYGNYLAPNFLSSFPIGMGAGAIYMVMASLLMGASNGLMLRFLNRIAFVEYASEMPQKRYHRFVTAITVTFTLVMGVLMTFGLLGPQVGPLLTRDSSLIALLAGLAAAVVGALTAGLIAHSYTGRYFAVREKRKNESLTALDDGLSLSQALMLDSDGELALRPFDPLEGVDEQDGDTMTPGLVSG